MNQTNKSTRQNGAKTKTRNGNGRKNGNGNGTRTNGYGNGKTLYTLATKTPTRPFAWASDNTRLIDNSTTTHTGSDFIQHVRVVPAPQTASERIIGEFPISPSMFPGTRMTQFSQLYEFYKFCSLRLRYVPAVPVTLACQLVVYVDLDPSDNPAAITNPDTLVRQAVAQTGAMQWNFHTPKNIPMAMRTDQQYYYTGEDKQNPRFSQQGRAYIIQVTDPVDFNGGAIPAPLTAGSIFFDWKCKFNIPQLNPAGLVTNQTKVVPAITSGSPYADTNQVVTYVRAAVPTSWTPSWLISGTTISLLKPRTQYVISPSGTGLVDLSITFSLTVAGRELGNLAFNIQEGVSEVPPPFCITTDNLGFPEQLVVFEYVNGTPNDDAADIVMTIAPLNGVTSAFNSDVPLVRQAI